MKKARITLRPSKISITILEKMRTKFSFISIFMSRSTKNGQMCIYIEGGAAADKRFRFLRKYFGSVYLCVEPR